MEIASILKYEGDNATFIWKHPKEDFNTNTQLIVHETQEAIFFMNGQALDLFGPGRYTLETDNLPLLRKVTSIPTDGKTPFHCEVYFINKTEQMAIRWGTNSRIQYIDPTYQFPLSIGANGEMSLAVSDSRRLLLQLVGTESLLTQEKLVAFFRAILMTKIKTYLAKEMREKAISIFEVDEKLEEFSSDIKSMLENDFGSYGVKLMRFMVTTIVKPDGEAQYERFKDLHFRKYAAVAEAQLQQQIDLIEQQTKAKKMVIESQGIAQKRVIEGYTYQQERGFDVAEGAAKNEGSAGNFAGMGIGLGMMAGVGGTVGGAVGNVVKNVFDGMDINAQKGNMFCDQCGAELTPGAAFCDHCGAAQADSCPHCGFVFIKPGLFCPKCGSKRGNSHE